MKLGSSRNQCGGCKQYFNSNGAFEAHRTGKFGVDRRCKTPEEIETSGYRLNADGFWTSTDTFKHPSMRNKNDLTTEG